MARSVRTLLGSLALGAALALPGLQIAQGMAPLAAHAAPASQIGNVLAGSWVNYNPHHRFTLLAVTGGTASDANDRPVAVDYGVNVFDVPGNRWVAFGEAAPVPYTAAGTATFPLRPLVPPAPQGPIAQPIGRRFAVSTTITLTLRDSATVLVTIRDYSPLFGNRFSTELMQRPTGVAIVP